MREPAPRTRQDRGRPRPTGDGASVAFEALGVELRRLKSVEEAREEALARFKLLAQLEATNGSSDHDGCGVGFCGNAAKRSLAKRFDRAEKGAAVGLPSRLSGVGPAQCPDEVKEER